MGFPDRTEKRITVAKGLVPRRARPLVFVFAVLGLLVALSAPAPRADDGASLLDLELVPEFIERVGIMQIEPNLRLQPVSPDELLVGGPTAAVSAGRWTPGGLTTRLQPIEAHIVRNLPSVWRMRVRDMEAVDGLDVRYEIADASGRPGVLSAEDGSGSEIRIHVDSLAPTVVLQDASGTVLEGALILRLDVENARTAGRYTGTLTVTVDHF